MSTPNASETTSTEQLSTSAPTKRKRGGRIGMGIAIALIVIVLLAGLAGGYFLNAYLTKSSAPVQITETGSTLLYPLMNIWGPNYTAFNSHVTLSTLGTGSGAGQSGAETGTYNIGASDAYVANFTQTSIINVPVAISAQLVYYNLPGVTGHLNLNGTVLAMIYNQTITTWANPLILNAQSSTVQGELKALPSNAQTIVLLKRADSSGDTFLFTSLCYQSWNGFGYLPKTSGFSGLATKGSSTVIPETGNSGMVTGIEGQPGGIAYIGISYQKSVTGANVNYAAIGDNLALSASGGVNPSNYILPSAQNISEDANLGLTNLNFTSYGLAISLILGGVKDTLVTANDYGNGGTNPTATYSTPYPIVNLEYSLIKTSPVGNTVTSSSLAATVMFLEWAIGQGNQPVYLNQVGFVPLTTTVLGYDMIELGQVSV